MKGKKEKEEESIPEHYQSRVGTFGVVRGHEVQSNFSMN